MQKINIIQHKKYGQNENFDATMVSYDGACVWAKYVYVINILATIIDKQERD